MESLERVREIVIEILEEYSTHIPSNGQIEMELIFDRERDRYQLVAVGWNKATRVYGSMIHIDLKGDKIWIQNDGTEVGIANLLVEQGIPPKSIILAYHAPYLRHYTEFGIE